MRVEFRLLIAVGLGSVAGWFARQLTFGGDRATVISEPPDGPELLSVPAAPVLGASSEVGAPLPELVDGAAACRRQVAFLMGQLEVYEGVPQAWPESVLPAFAEESLPVALDEAWRDVGEVFAVDCSEYPCLVAVELTNGDSHCCPQLVERLPPEWGDPYVRMRSLSPASDASMFAIVAIGDGDVWSDEIESRTDWRIDAEAEQILSDYSADQ